MGAVALQAIDRALAEGQLGIASISFWEIAMLVGKGRLDIRMELDVWRLELLRNGLQEIPLDGATALRSAQLQDFHGDPADRMIVATALTCSASLATADRKILTWGRFPRKIDATL